jgi:galactonate dehydratase
MAEAYYVQLAPHSWYGPVSLAASLHLDACIPNFLIQETPVPHQVPPQQRDLLTAPLEMAGGTMAIPTGPGLGITLNETVLERHRIAG